ncbi:M2 family metallopeptidase [Massilia sp. H-1]|nr:M2 family metallopeptidase [Massilia sp. H-1]
MLVSPRPARTIQQHENKGRRHAKDNAGTADGRPWTEQSGAGRTGRQKGAPTVAEAERFVADAEARLKKLEFNAARTDWVYQTYITDDTEAITAQVG